MIGLFMATHYNVGLKNSNKKDVSIFAIYATETLPH